MLVPDSTNLILEAPVVAVVLISIAWLNADPLSISNIPSEVTRSLSVPSVTTLKCPLEPVSTTSADVLFSSILSLDTDVGTKVCLMM